MTSAQAAKSQDFAAALRLQPSEAAAYLQSRDQLTLTWSWRDLWQEEHAQQFTVSRLARLDLLEAIRDKISASVNGDMSRSDFKRDAEQLLSEAGFWGEKTVIDQADGREVTTTFNPPRLELIFDVNTRMAYASGQWERFQQTRRSHPYIRYITKGDERVRESHRAWANVTLPVDHDFWQTHLPPNGWRCRCRVVAVSQREYDRGIAPGGAPMRKAPPEVTYRDWVDRRTGQIRQVPAGIDPGFGYNVGVASTRAEALYAQVAEKLAKTSPDLAAAARNAGLTTDRGTE